jgi:type II secretory pathway pseudopilin PulG
VIVHKASSGFSYVALLILIAILSIAATATVQAGAAVQRRQAEQELLRIGMEFERALASYKSATPAGTRGTPQSLEDLLSDPRFVGTRRHLRAVRPDPISGRPEWGLVRGPDGGIVAVHSLSSAAPIKVAGFATGYERLANAGSYADWLFGDVSQLGVKPFDRVRQAHP